MDGDLHMLATYDVHADQTHLVRMLKKGHHNVKLDKEAWSRLVTWIDLNAPAHGSWTEIAGTQRVDRMKERRDELMKLYGNVTFDPEVSFLATDTTPKFKPVKPAKLVRPASIRDKFPPKVVGKAEKKEMVLPLNEKLSLKLVKIPAGEYVAGNVNGAQDEFREQQVKISEPFWIGTCEITNEQYALFDPSHDSRLEHGDFLHFADIPARGTLLNEPQQPVARISQQQALAFCEWLSKKTGKKVTLPTEQQWEWAARFGRLNDAPFQKQGFANRDFSKLANLADIAFHETTSRAVPSYRPGIESVDDGNRVSAPVASFEPDEAGVYDLTGNVAEWTTSEWVSPLGEKLPPHSVAKGGSWRDLPHNAGAGSRMPLRPEMTFLDVGFRVIVEE